MDVPVVYRRRRGRLSRGEREWRVEDDALVTQGGAGRTRRYKWSDIVSVRLCAEPARKRPWRYVFELQPKHQRKIVIDNAHFRGGDEYEERSDAYVSFVRAALAHWADGRPKARILIGETPKRYFFLLLAALIAFVALACALVLVPTPLDNAPYAGVIKLLLIVALLPLFWRGVLTAAPRGVSPDAIPERALPPK